MPLDVGQLVVQIIGVGFAQVIDDSADMKRFETLFGKILVEQVGVHEQEHEFRIEPMFVAHGGEGPIAQPEPNAEPVHEGDQTGMLLQCRTQRGVACQ